MDDDLTIFLAAYADAITQGIHALVVLFTGLFG